MSAELFCFNYTDCGDFIHELTSLNFTVINTGEAQTHEKPIEIKAEI